jgi:hypothetical protein
MMMPCAVAMMVMAMQADTHADAANMNADADTGGSGCCAQQAQSKNGNEQCLHSNPSWNTALRHIVNVRFTIKVRYRTICDTIVALRRDRSDSPDDANDNQQNDRTDRRV